MWLGGPRPEAQRSEERGTTAYACVCVYVCLVSVRKLLGVLLLIPTVGLERPGRDEQTEAMSAKCEAGGGKGGGRTDRGRKGENDTYVALKLIHLGLELGGLLLSHVLLGLRRV